MAMWNYQRVTRFLKLRTLQKPRLLSKGHPSDSTTLPATQGTRGEHVASFQEAKAAASRSTWSINVILQLLQSTISLNNSTTAYLCISDITGTFWNCHSQNTQKNRQSCFQAFSVLLSTFSPCPLQMQRGFVKLRASARLARENARARSEGLSGHLRSDLAQAQPYQCPALLKEYWIVLEAKACETAVAWVYTVKMLCWTNGL